MGNILYFPSNFTAAGLKWVSDTFKLCKPLGKGDVPAFKDYLNNLWTNIAMMDYPYPTTFLMPLPGHPVKVLGKLERRYYGIVGLVW